MSSILISVATLIVMFILVGYGSYTGYYSFKRSTYVTAVGGAFERQVTAVRGIQDDLGRVPNAADVPQRIFSKEARSDVTYSYGVASGHGYVCALTSTRDWAVDAFTMISSNSTGAFVGPACDATGTPGANVAVSMRIS